MENASKALIMAGGILLTMAIVGLVIFAWNKFSDYYRKDDNLADIDDLTEFNLQFTNYERDDIHGYELVSLANKVFDYNTRRSNAAGNKSNEWYNTITMTIDFNGMQDKFRYSNDLTSRELLFKNGIYSNNGIDNFIHTATGIEEVYGGTDTATKLAKSIDSLILTQEQIDYNQNYKKMSPVNSKWKAVQDYISISKDKSILGGKKVNESISEDEINNIYSNMQRKLTNDASIMKYYEYYQFKRGIFKCTSTDITYDQPTGRVSTIKFTFTGKIE